jgi:hypothetical protein
LDASLRNGTPDFLLAGELESALRELAAAIDAIPTAPTATEASALDGARLKEILDELESLLAEDNVLSNGFLRQWRVALGPFLGARLSDLAALIDAYRYEEALASLRSFRDKP